MRIRIQEEEQDRMGWAGSEKFCWCDWVRGGGRGQPTYSTVQREKGAPREGDSTLNTPAQDVSGATKNLSLKEPCNMHVSHPPAQI